jgi:HTH-type transcriptional regulator/antitoxin HigA
MAFSLSKVFGTSVELWLNLNNHYIEKKVEIQKAQERDEECDLARNIDYSYFVKLDVLPVRRKIADKVEEFQKYFHVTSLRVLYQPDLLVQFKTAVPDIKENNILNANVWLQTAINMARNMETKPYDEKYLRNHLEDIRQMTTMQPEVFEPRLKKIMANAGVSLVLLPHLKNCGINGAVKWINKDKAMIAMNDRRRYSDYFWFALFHEIGHVLQKRIKLLIVDNHSTQSFTNEELVRKLEDEANAFAQNTLINPTSYKEFINSNHSFCAETVSEYAKKININPGIVVGRLQRESLITYKQLNQLRLKYSIGSE